MSIEKYNLPRNISYGLGWTSQGTVPLGDTIALLDADTEMPENDGNIYAWQRNGYVRKIGVIDAGDIKLNESGILEGDNRLILAFNGEIIAVEQGMTVLLPDDAILTVYELPDLVGKFIMVGDKYAKSAISSIDDSNKFKRINGEGVILDNVILSLYEEKGIYLNGNVAGTISHFENVLFDDSSVNGVHIDSSYTGNVTILNNIFDQALAIDNLHASATLDVRNNRIRAVVTNGMTDFSNVIRNNYIHTVTPGLCTIPTEEQIPNWYTITDIKEMEVYQGNITGDTVIPQYYGFIYGYGKVELGVNGGLPYLDKLAMPDAEHVGATQIRLKWEKLQENIANSYRISMATKPPPYDRYVDVGDVYEFIIKDGINLDGYPDDNDWDLNGIPDTRLNLGTNRVWYFNIQAQILLGDKLLIHLSEKSDDLATPVRTIGIQPDYSIGLDFPIVILNGEFKVVQKSDSIKAGLYLIVMQNVGERVLYPSGAGLRPFLFENQLDPDLVNLAREHIRIAISELEPRVTLEAIQFALKERDDGSNAILVNISYRDTESSEPVTQTIGIPYGTN